MSFLAELRRRNVIRMAGLYLVGAWLVVQVAGTLLPIFHTPDWVLQALVVLLALGYIPALAFSWIFELTPQGLKRDDDVSLEASIAPKTARRMDRMIIVGLLLAFAWVGFDRIALAPRRDAAVVATPARAPPVASETRDALIASEKSIAVLPFVNMSPDKDNEYFSDGVSEEILNALAKVDDLKVAGRTSSFSFKGTNESLTSIGGALGVAHLLEGSVRKQGDKVRITAQLIRAKDGFHLWSETYDGDLADVFALQERIARSITDELKVVLNGDQQSRLVHAGTSNAEAYALFLQATAIYNRRDYEHMDAAIASLEEAVALDPAFARAQARLAAVHVIFDNRDAPWMELAERNARKAIELDATLAEPHAVLGRVYFEQRRHVESRAAFERALVLDPEDVTTIFWRAMALIMTGYTREGIAQLDRALALDPAQPILQLWRALEFSFASDQVSAQRAAQRSADLGLSFAAYAQAEVAHAQGDDAKATAYLGTRWKQRVTECGAPAPEAAETYMAGVYSRDPEVRARALAVVERCVASETVPTPFWTTSALLRLDQPARALAVAQTRRTDNETFLFQLLWSPYGKGARQLPEFAEFARKTGLADAWEAYGPPDLCQRRAERDYVCQ